MALDTQLAPLYGNQVLVRNRTSAALNYWAGYQATLPIPTEKPDSSWVKQRITAERVTNTPVNYLDRVMGYYTQDPTIQTNMRDLMDGFPTDAEETTYKGFMESSTSAVMTRFSEFEVSNDQVQAWYDQNGFAEEPEEPPAELTGRSERRVQ